VYCQLAHSCGITADWAQQQAARFVDAIVELLEAVGLPSRVEVPQDAPEDLAGKLARNAVESTSKPLRGTPREIDEPALKALFEEILTRPAAATKPV
jgi:alcohol dehydrogenase class IV